MIISSLILSLCFSFHLVPVSSSSFYVHSTVTTAVLSWRLHRLQHLSRLSLYDTRTQSVTNTFDINSSEAKSQYRVRGLQPGTRFRADVVVTAFLKHLEISLNQRLRINTETGIVHCCALLFELVQPGLLLQVEADVQFCLNSSVSCWLAGQWEQLLHHETDRIELAWCPTQMHRPGSWKSPGWSEDPWWPAVYIFSPAEAQQPAAAVDRTQWSAGSLITGMYTLAFGSKRRLYKYYLFSLKWRNVDFKISRVLIVLILILYSNLRPH